MSDRDWRASKNTRGADRLLKRTAEGWQVWARAQDSRRVPAPSGAERMARKPLGSGQWFAIDRSAPVTRPSDALADAHED